MFLQTVREGQQWHKGNNIITVVDVNEETQNIVIEMNGILADMTYFDFCYQIHHLVSDVKIVPSNERDDISGFKNHGDIFRAEDGNLYMILRGIRSNHNKYSLYQLNSTSFDPAKIKNRNEVKLTQRIYTTVSDTSSALVDSVLIKGVVFKIHKINNKNLEVYNPITEEVTSTGFGVVRYNLNTGALDTNDIEVLQEKLSNSNNILDEDVRELITNLGVKVLYNRWVSLVPQG